MESLLIAHVRSENPEPSHPHVPIPTLRLRRISVGGDCSSLIQLFTALRAPILAAAGLHTMCDNPQAEAYADYESSFEAFSTACSPATITEICITLDENAEGPTLTAYLYDLLKPLLVFPNLKHFSMLCPMLELFSDDDDFDVFTRTWRKLRKFELLQAYTVLVLVLVRECGRDPSHRGPDAGALGVLPGPLPRLAGTGAALP